VMSYLGAAAMLGAIAIVASWIPARRAARLHPMASLRAD
jgi:ABC-type antimicrobial peptide transport system permease subunit